MVIQEAWERNKSRRKKIMRVLYIIEISINGGMFTAQNLLQVRIILI
jgi:hypothetical protein